MKKNEKLVKGLGIVLHVCLIIFIGILLAPIKVQADTAPITKSDFVIQKDGQEIDFWTNTQNTIKDYIEHHYEHYMPEEAMRDYIRDKYYCMQFFSAYNEEQKTQGFEQPEYKIARDIEFGNTATKIAKKYGKATKKKFTTAENANNWLINGYVTFNAENISFYYEYKLASNKKYSIRFYFNDKDELTNIAFFYQAKHCDRPLYKDGGSLPIKAKKGQTFVEKTFSGYTYYYVSRNAILKGEDEVNEIKKHNAASKHWNPTLYYDIFIIDKKGHIVYEKKDSGDVKDFFDGNSSLIDNLRDNYIEYSTGSSVPWKTVKKVLTNQNKNLFITLYVYDKDKTCGKHNYVYRFKIK